MDDVVIEFVQQGRFVKVSAVDMKTGQEAAIVGDAKASQSTLKQLAIKKLNYVMQKNKLTPR